jgi:hypothetical protein
MKGLQLTLQSLEDGEAGTDSNTEVPRMYLVEGLDPGIELAIYRKLGQWWITGVRPGQRSYWPGGYDSTRDALAAISYFFLSPKHRAAQKCEE